jgi:hypothetical protein
MLLCRETLEGLSSIHEVRSGAWHSSVGPAFYLTTHIALYSCPLHWPGWPCCLLLTGRNVFLWLSDTRHDYLHIEVLSWASRREVKKTLVRSAYVCRTSHRCPQFMQVCASNVQFKIEVVCSFLMLCKLSGNWCELSAVWPGTVWSFVTVRQTLTLTQLSMCTTRRYLGKGCDSCTRSWPSYCMAGSGQSHAPVAVRSGKEPHYQLNRRSVSPNDSLCSAKEGKVLTFS